MSRISNPLLWAALYFIQIAVFAGVYYVNSTSFYHSTSLVEPHLDADESELEVRLLEAIRSDYRERNDEYFDNPRIPPDYIRDMMSDMPWQVDLQYIPFGRTEYSTRFRFISIEGYSIDATLFLREDGDSLNPEGLWFQIQRPEPTDDPNFLFRTSALIAVIEESRHPETVRMFTEWVDAQIGRPSRNRGVVVRMLYLSIVTTTTLGYGDIVPTTSAMRLVISAQTILGVIISALFINALIERRASKT